MLGALLLFWFLSPSERGRIQRVERLQFGDSEARVTALLGAPAARCPAGNLAHLRPSFPPGWPTPSLETTLQALALETGERLVFPLEEGAAADCLPEEGRTEVGLDGEGRVLWHVAILGETPLRLPERFAPAAAADTGSTAEEP